VLLERRDLRAAQVLAHEDETRILVPLLNNQSCGLATVQPDTLQPDRPADGALRSHW
jgi:hypothetical protein